MDPKRVASINPWQDVRRGTASLQCFVALKAQAPCCMASPTVHCDTCQHCDQTLMRAAAVGVMASLHVQHQHEKEQGQVGIIHDSKHAPIALKGSCGAVGQSSRSQLRSRTPAHINTGSELPWCGF